MRAGKVGCFFLVCELSFHFNSPGDFFGSIGHSRERGQRHITSATLLISLLLTTSAFVVNISNQPEEKSSLHYK